MVNKVLLILAIIGALGIIGAYQWKQQTERQKAQAKILRVESEILKTLNAEEVSLIIENDPQNDKYQLTSAFQDPLARQRVLRDLRETLSLAAQARREDVAEEDAFKYQFELSKKVLLAQLYEQKKGRENSAVNLATPEELAVFWAKPLYEEQFNANLEAQFNFQQKAAGEQGQMPPQRLTGEKLEKARKVWAKATIISEKANADNDFIVQRGVLLRIRLLEAELLAQQYLQKQFARRIKAAREEITAYLAAHPEYDVQKKREKAETALRRAQAGEDFALLVREFSEDRVGKDKNGLYENMTSEDFLPEVENAVVKLEKGRVADYLIESAYGWHIVKLEGKKTVIKAGGTAIDSYSFRQILLHKGFTVETPGSAIPSPFYPPEHIARKAIENNKQQQLIVETVERNPIQLPEDFDFKAMAEVSLINSQTVIVSPKERAKNSK